MGVRVAGCGKYVPDRGGDERPVAPAASGSTRTGSSSGLAIPSTATRPAGASDERPLRAGWRRTVSPRAATTAKDCDLLVLGTFTPDFSFPSTAALVQDRLGMVGPAVEVEAACAGFMYALVTRRRYVVSGASDRALVIGADANSRVLNPDDIKTYPLFATAAGR